MCDLIYIKPSCRDISGNQYLKLTFSESAHCFIALSLRQISMKRICVITILNQFIGYFLGLPPGAAKHDCVNIWSDIRQTPEQFVAVPGRNHVTHVFYIVSTFVHWRNRDLKSVTHVLFGDSHNVFRRSCREKQGLLFIWCLSKDCIQVFFEAHA